MPILVKWFLALVGSDIDTRDSWLYMVYTRLWFVKGLHETVFYSGFIDDSGFTQDLHRTPLYARFRQDYGSYKVYSTLETVSVV